MNRALCVLLMMALPGIAVAQCAPGVAGAGNPACIPQGSPGSPYGNPSGSQDPADPRAGQGAPDAAEAYYGGPAVYTRQQALARESWGAVVIDQPTGSAYGRYDQLTELAATKNTRIDCKSAGNARCEVLATYKNTCIAVASGAPGTDKTPLFWATAPNPGDAAFAALEKCGSADQCEVFYQRCTNPPTH
jgi:hypothetical protein